MVIDDSNVVVGPAFQQAIDSTLGELLLLMLGIYNQEVLQIDAATGEQQTACLLGNRAILLAKWLQKNGFSPGDRISLSSENRLEYCVVSVAAFLAGVTLAPLNPDYTPREVRHVLDLSRPKLIFCSPKTLEGILSNRSQYPYLQSIVCFGRQQPQHKGVIMFEDIIKGAKTDSLDGKFQAVRVDPKESVAIILCSSGTTGMPKGVMLTHFNITAYLEIISYTLEAHMGVDNNEGKKIMTGIAPFFHGMGFMIMLLTMLGNQKLIVYSKFDPKQFLESISKYKITSIVVPPPIIFFLTKHPMVKNYDLSSVETVKSGAAPIGKELEQEALKKLKLQSIGQSYGMTEATLGVLVSVPNKNKSGSVGKVVAGMKCKVIDEQGNALGANKEGELCFKGPLIMKGYVNNPKATNETIDKDNWLHSGDVGYYDDEGFFFIVDRIKELIKYKGFQVAPAELEGLLMIHPAVADAAVVGVADERVGELPLAFVVKKSGQEVTAKELEKYIAERVSTTKQLRGGVHFVNEIPRNPTGKILRRILRERATKMRSQL